MADKDLALRAQDLGDVELAMLLSLIAKEHCIIQTEEEALDALEEEVRLIASNVLGLSCSSLHCTRSTTLEDFTHGLLIDESPMQSLSSPRYSNRRASAYNFERSYSGERYQVSQVFIARSIGESAHQVQMQALELLRTKRIFTHTGVYSVPKPFLMIVISSPSSPSLSKHLNDFLFISHFHGIDEGFPNVEESSGWVEDDKASISSVVHKTAPKAASVSPIFSNEDLESLSSLSQATVISLDVKRYLHDVLTFLRFHRAVASGVSPRATRHFDLLVRCLAPLHGLSFATPSIVALAARKIYAHRLTLVTPGNERSMQYGSDEAAIAELLAGLTVSMVIEETLLEVDVPL